MNNMLLVVYTEFITKNVKSAKQLFTVIPLKHCIITILKELDITQFHKIDICTFLYVMLMHIC